MNLYCLFLAFSWSLLSLHAYAASVERSTYIVHMDRSLMPKAFSSHHDWYLSTINSLGSKSSNPSLVYTYNEAAHGFSALLSAQELEALKASSGFLSAYSDKTVTLDTTHTSEFLSLNPFTGLWPAADYGQDVIIGMIDTGIWPESESFNDNGVNAKNPRSWKGECEEAPDFNSSMCNNKLIGARSMKKGAMAANPEVYTGLDSARDEAGHGTHTSSTAGGNFVNDVSFFGYAEGRATGVAPLSKLAMYNVFSGDGSFYSDVLAAMDKAVADGVDVISISMGLNGEPLYADPIAIASFAAMERNVFVSSSAGNDGPGLATLHNGVPWVLTVAAGTVDRWFAGTLTLGNGLTITGWSMFPINAAVQGAGLVYNKTLSACNSTELLSQAPYGIIICDDLGSIEYQMPYVAAANLLGAIFISDEPELGNLICPAVVISSKEAETVIRYAQTGHYPSASIDFQETYLHTVPAPVVASYSSRGPSPSCPGILKPDVLAPGSQILAAWPSDIPAAKVGANMLLSSNYNILSGTSMACPHASGLAALLKAAHPEWSSAAIRSAMMTTANPIDNTMNPIKDYGRSSQIASPLAMGAGHIDPNRALDPGLIYDATPQDYVNLLCSMNYTMNQILTITRSRSYNCSNPSPDLNYPSFIALYGGGSGNVTRQFHRTVTNVGEGNVSYKAAVVAPEGCVVSVSPEVLVFGEVYEKQSYVVSVVYGIGSDEKQEVSFGEVVWVEEGGAHTVRSPIVVSPMFNS